MLKLYDKFLRKFLLLYGGVFLILGFIVYFWLKDIYIEQTKVDLIQKLEILTATLENLETIDKKIDLIKEKTGLRVTVIEKDGKVIAESDKELDMIKNHKDRVELLQSLDQSYGSDIRRSDTINKDLLYVAKKFTIDQKIYFIRIARDIDQLNKEFFSLSFKVMVVFLIFMIFSYLITASLGKKIEYETLQILNFLKNLTTKQKKEHTIESNFSYEFFRITQLLSEVSRALMKKEKQKSKYTAKLKISNRQKDDILSAISHEFKNPIAVISGYTQTLLDDKDINPNIREKFLQKISSNADKLTNMINRLRLTLRLEEGRQVKNFTQVSLASLVKNIIEDLKITYPSREIYFESIDLTIEADETMIRVAIENLIENGLKYSQEDIYVSITHHFISVRDNGIGIKPKDQEKITHKFYRVSNNTWNNSLGVGLSLVSHIVKFHNFRLDIQSIENEGSTFTIYFQPTKEN